MRIILTGEHEAIDLKALHGEEVLRLDDVVHGICERNGGYAELVIDLIKGLFIRLHINNETHIFRKVIERHKKEE